VWIDPSVPTGGFFLAGASVWRVVIGKDPWLGIWHDEEVYCRDIKEET
jgi:hypothetical protein